MTVIIRETFKTEAEAQAFKDKYLEAYCPAGYGTTLKKWQSDSGCWFVSGSRYSSAD
jgi:hypothetical protein